MQPSRQSPWRSCWKKNKRNVGHDRIDSFSTNENNRRSRSSPHNRTRASFASCPLVGWIDDGVSRSREEGGLGSDAHLGVAAVALPRRRRWCQQVTAGGSGAGTFSVFHLSITIRVVRWSARLLGRGELCWRHDRCGVAHAQRCVSSRRRELGGRFASAVAAQPTRGVVVWWWWW